MAATYHAMRPRKSAKMGCGRWNPIAVQLPRLGSPVEYNEIRVITLVYWGWVVSTETLRPKRESKGYHWGYHDIEKTRSGPWLTRFPPKIAHFS